MSVNREHGVKDVTANKKAKQTIAMLLINAYIPSYTGSLRVDLGSPCWLQRINQSLSLSLCLPICLSVCLSVCVVNHHTCRQGAPFFLYHPASCVSVCLDVFSRQRHNVQMIRASLSETYCMPNLTQTRLMSVSRMFVDVNVSFG